MSGEQAWHRARLIPTSGINGAEEQERRATSALLAVVSSVKEFGRTLTRRVGAPAGTIETYVEVPFQTNGHKAIPDGLIHVTRGKTSWTALVEVKTGANELQAQQLETYLDIAKAEGFDAVVTISNEIRGAAGEHPTCVDKRKLRKVGLHHLSWTQILSDAVMEKTHRGVADPDQAWILGELIRYLEHPKSGALEFDDMGPHWVETRNAARAGTLRASDPGPSAVTDRFDQLLRFVSLRLGRELGTDVQFVLSRAEARDPSLRSQALLTDLVDNGRLSGTLRIPDTIGPLTVCADLRAAQVTASVEVSAPQQGRNTTRVRWLLRQLKDGPETLRIDAYARHSRGSMSALLRDVRDNEDLLIEDRSREIRRYMLHLTEPMGTKRGNGRGSFIASTIDVVDRFYGQVVQSVRPWTPPAPRMRKPDDTTTDATGISSQDGSDTHGPTEPQHTS
ncbi:MAG TPA: hypothetical protein VK875_10995 [Euzebyales bacterium]|nr:hypothetical protein [Euzebyales bacterium]